MAPRLYLAMSGDGLFPAALAALHPATQAPARATALLAAIASVLRALRDASRRSWRFFMCTTLVFVGARRRGPLRRPAAPPARRRRLPAPGYPATPALFVLLVGRGHRHHRPGPPAPGSGRIRARCCSECRRTGYSCRAERSATGRSRWRRAMTWIKTIPFSEADEKLRERDRGPAHALSRRSTRSRPASRTRPGSIVASHSLIPDALLPRLRDLRRPDVARPAADPAAARDDHDGRLGDEPVPLLNRVSRRVSASGDTG